MKKNLVKHVFNLIDLLEIHGIRSDEIPSKILSMQNQDNEYQELTQQNIKEILNYASKFNFITNTHRGIDLSASATIFAKSESYSIMEALAIFETYLKNESLKQFFTTMLNDNTYFSITSFESLINDNLAYQILCQTILFESKDQDQFHFNPQLINYLINIIKEMEHNCLLSHILLSIYTNEVIPDKEKNIEYRNQNNEMIQYSNLNDILTILPHRGIPVDRDETRLLQSFFKDTLFHEFDHCCAICGIDLPHMLIASHIKPFRDCAHIIECVDHNNGLLLCRNHDYLFDQGYFSFNENGTIIISEELLKKENFNSKYVLSHDIKLSHLSEERKQFLSYHRNHIFLK